MICSEAINISGLRCVILCASDMTQGEGDSREEKLRNYCLGKVVTNYNDNDVLHVSDVSFGDFDGVSAIQLLF